MRVVLVAACIAASLALPLPAPAHDGPHAPDAEHAEAAAPDAGASPDAAQRAAAKQRLERAEAAYGLMRRRDHPRGDARAKIVQELHDARAEWARLSAEWAEPAPAN